MSSKAAYAALNNDYKLPADTLYGPLFLTAPPIVLASMSPSPGGTNPLAAALVFSELERLIDKKKIRRTFLRLFGRKRVELADLRDRVQESLGVELPLADKYFGEIMNEVHRFQWLEAERAGRDIWKERNPRDPEAGAIREWFSRHFGAWYLYNRRAKSTT